MHVCNRSCLRMQNIIKSAAFTVSLIWIVGVTAGILIASQLNQSLTEYFTLAIQHSYSAVAAFLWVGSFSLLYFCMAAGKRSSAIWISLILAAKAVITGINVFCISAVLPSGGWLGYLLFCFSDLYMSSIILHKSLIYFSGMRTFTFKKFIATSVRILIYSILDIFIIKALKFSLSCF